jgi:hypothetical protein
MESNSQYSADLYIEQRDRKQFQYIIDWVNRSKRGQVDWGSVQRRWADPETMQYWYDCLFDSAEDETPGEKRKWTSDDRAPPNKMLIGSDPDNKVFIYYYYYH